MAVTKEYAQQVLKKYRQQLTATPGVISVGLTIVNGVYTIHIRVHGDPLVKFPDNLEGVPVKVSRSHPQRLFAGFREKYRPVPMGVSIGTKSYTFVNPWSKQTITGSPTGSSGFYIINKDGTFMVTVSHLWWLAVHSAWQKEHGVKSPDELRKLPQPDLAGEVCLQPGMLDGGTSRDAIGRLVKYTLTPVGISDSDGSLIELNAQSLAAKALPDGTEVTATAEPEIGEQVIRIGRTTGLSYGMVEEIDANVRFNVPEAGYDAILEDTFVVFMYSAPGDSGGPVLNAKNQLLGLCSGSGPTVTTCTKVSNLIKALEVQSPVRFIVPKIPQLLFAGALGVLALSFILGGED